ncbi:4-hydroxybenzoate polyprenyltransferase, mitochondrial-like isoform X4 [Tripterygium wilfordii]|uniref:4-hydroxybenzoate polyprenyltransferase, mitochondrial-like isoform X4 n=1 Tax=Tripterygium wilfordii TaxID=458696 RepID=UPI0018F823F1|nr:4-hydroxybenzoate polyprenyltransferase, mitochondrial-like isoform X4 [Tripterygium wilfordii]
MASFWVSRASRGRRSLKPSLSSLFLSNPLTSPTRPTPAVNPNPSLIVIPIRQFSILTPSFKFSRENEESSCCSNLALVRRISTLSNSKNEDNKHGTGRELSWIDLYLPRQARPYAHLARLDKPIGTWLLAWPCMWSITMVASPGHLPDFKMMALFGCGALLLRGAGCTVNDLLDRDIDTKPHFGSFIFVSGLFLSSHEEVYILEQPQAFLGLTFNWGALLGWAAVKGTLDPAIVFPLYASGVFWTLVYDTIYAHQDKEDDLKVGVKSTALRFGDSTKLWITGFGMACIGCLGISGYNADNGWPFYLFLMGASGQLAWQIWTVNIYCRTDCNRKFVSNKWFGAIVFSGILFGRLLS